MSPRATSTHPLNISRDGDSFTALGSLIKCLMTLPMKKFFSCCPTIDPKQIFHSKISWNLPPYKAVAVWAESWFGYLVWHLLTQKVTISSKQRPMAKDSLKAMV